MTNYCFSSSPEIITQKSRDTHHDVTARRDDSHFSELPNATLENFVGYVKTWSGFREMVKKSGETEGEKLIDGMVTR